MALPTNINWGLKLKLAPPREGGGVTYVPGIYRLGPLACRKPMTVYITYTAD